MRPVLTWMQRNATARIAAADEGRRLDAEYERLAAQLCGATYELATACARILELVDELRGTKEKLTTAWTNIDEMKDQMQNAILRLSRAEQEIEDIKARLPPPAANGGGKK